MKNQIALLSDNQEIQGVIASYYPSIELFRSIESIKRDDFSILLTDFDIFGSIDSIQFLLSKIRKKIQDKPVLLILKDKSIAELHMDWFFDDFILFPFKKEELYARINRILWQKGIDDDTVAIGRLIINFKEYSVYMENEKLDLTYKEFELLRLLVSNKGEVFSRKDLLSKIWGVEYIGGTRTVDVHIRRLRGKLGDEFNSIIETVRNVGYRCKV
ncbi:MAG: response regulator transcription factor [Spirochaetes bacterium]|nr:response regulator transcription factor [Spirochaetota bacterium]